jgi:histidinol phosphatase-like PHP family hydrolase
MINDRSKGTIEDFLGQFDFHVHSFSHCVFSKRGELGASNIMDWSLKTKLAYIQFSLEKICDAAREKGLKMMCVVEHPQFKRYNVPYGDYMGCFRNVKKNAKGDIILLNGIELNLKIGNDGNSYLDREEVNDGTEDWKSILSKADIIIGAVHYKDIKADRRLFKRSFHYDALKKTITELSKLKKELRDAGAKEKIAVLGHPADFIGEINEKEYAKRKEKSIRPDYGSFAEYLCSRDAAARFLSENMLQNISRLLYKNEIYPEFNSSYIQKKHSDIRSQEPYPRTLLGTYIQIGIKTRRTPFIIPSSDSHRFEEVGVLSLDTVKKRVHNLDSADVPYRPLLR